MFYEYGFDDLFFFIKVLKDVVGVCKGCGLGKVKVVVLKFVKVGKCGKCVCIILEIKVKVKEFVNNEKIGV